MAHVRKLLVLGIHDLPVAIEHRQRRNTLERHSILRRDILVRVHSPDVDVHAHEVLAQQLGVGALVEINIEHLAVGAPVAAEVHDHALV